MSQHRDRSPSASTFAGTEALLLRTKLIAEMRRHSDQRKGYSERDKYYPTWWFKGQIGVSATVARNELKKMEAEGLVKANRRQSNNHRWVLIECLGN
jgi:hypothetical protein